MSPDEHTPLHSDTNLSIGGDVNGVVVVGDNNTVHQTIIQKFFNIFKSDAETLEQRNRRILLNHVENAWIKGVLDASLYGTAMLDLGIKISPESVTDKYPWVIKKEATDETLPAGTSMLEIFDSIGMGRSLLILGAPGSGKTTMLLELARGLIARAREDITQPIPMVFNLASWTEKLTLADWLAQELNNLYSVPRKTAPDWVKGNKLLLLLDGLDEVRQDNRAKCVEAINAFRKQNGLTSLAVCSRSQDYADLKAKLAFEGAIEVQPLTQEQIAEFFNHFGEKMAGIKQAFKKDKALREMAETPLFLSIMLMAYQDKQSVDILFLGDEKARRKHLFDTYIEHMFERSKRSKDEMYKKQDVLRWLSWLAQKMIEHYVNPYFLENTQPIWLNSRTEKSLYLVIHQFLTGLGYALLIGLIGAFCGSITDLAVVNDPYLILGRLLMGIGLIMGLFFGLLFGMGHGFETIKTIDVITWSWKKAIIASVSIIGIVIFFGMSSQKIELSYLLSAEFRFNLMNWLFIGVLGSLVIAPFWGLEVEELNQTMYVGIKISYSIKNFLISFVLFGSTFGLAIGLLRTIATIDLVILLEVFGLIIGFMIALLYGGKFVIYHFILKFVLYKKKTFPWDIVLFLDYATKLIFLRRVGGGYIFVHRLLMEHFAEMYVEEKN